MAFMPGSSGPWPDARRPAISSASPAAIIASTRASIRAGQTRLEPARCRAPGNVGRAGARSTRRNRRGACRVSPDDFEGAGQPIYVPVVDARCRAGVGARELGAKSRRAIASSDRIATRRLPRRGYHRGRAGQTADEDLSGRRSRRRRTRWGARRGPRLFRRPRRRGARNPPDGVGVLLADVEDVYE